VLIDLPPSAGRAFSLGSGIYVRFVNIVGCLNGRGATLIRHWLAHRKALGQRRLLVLQPFGMRSSSTQHTSPAHLLLVPGKLSCVGSEIQCLSRSSTMHHQSTLYSHDTLH
jgi:hypothetical protein